ncbi:MAG TPA: Na+/H+ antiporter NhaC family protein [Rhodocyclaceae bacterium]|nr:Na+/H+ antiporter NhaC family protein [Rhodocyclaceae bacterium]
MSEANALAIQAPPQRPRLRLPQPVWLILLALALGLADGLSATDLVRTFSKGFGRSLGDFALILIPSFILAACLARQTLKGAPGVASAIAPVTAAGMVCPDTSYAALSSVAGNRKLSVAFGSFAGYKLLFPAGPLIVATSLGLDGSSLFFLGLVLLVPVWLAGEIWSRYRHRPAGGVPDDPAAPVFSLEMARALAPLILLGCLLLIGGLTPASKFPAFEFITRPKGALLVAAAVAMLGTDPERWKECFDSAMSRSASLLLVIGAASAFGAMLTQTLPIQAMIPASTTGVTLLLVVFAVSMAFKMAYGSSTVTFATVTPVLAPFVHAAGVSPTAAVLAICLGTFLILPTDSFYWLVRSDALAGRKESEAVTTLGVGALVQAGTGFAVLVALNLLDFV